MSLEEYFLESVSLHGNCGCLKEMDHISDLITRIRNAYRASLSSCIVTRTKVSISILHLLFLEGFISGYRVIDTRFVRVWLSYNSGFPIFKCMKRISRPSRRLYWSLSYVRRLLKSESNSLFVLSTSHGIVSGNYALANNLGGEIVCLIV